MTILSMVRRSILLKLYKNLALARCVNEALADLRRKEKIKGAVFSQLGQEAGGIGICSFLRKDDYLLPSYRDYSYVLSKGISLNALFAEHYGKRTGYCGGRGGGYRFFYPLKGIMGTSVSLGANFSIAVGLALAAKKNKRNNICVAVFGDGAASRGTFHGALNISALWKLPILWICENNEYSMSTHISKIHSVVDIAKKADGYGIFRQITDGNDVIKIYEICRGLIDRLRSGNGPVFLELKTRRMGEHRVGSAVNQSRNEKESKQWRKNDPLKICEKKLEKSGILNEKLKKAIADRSNSMINKAIMFAKKSSFPLAEELAENN